MNNPLISVITVVYNGIATLEQTMLSIINQTYKNIEYIIIDGGSTDGTIDIIKKYEKHLAYWVSEPDKGIYDAMNKGIDRATGEWVNFMNSGDWFFDIYVVNKVFESSQHDIDVVCGKIHGERMNKKTIDDYFFFRHTGIYHQSIFAKRHLLIDGFDTKYEIAADIEWLVRTYSKKHKFRSIDIDVAFYARGGISDINWKQVLDEKFEIFCKYYPRRIVFIRKLIAYFIMFFQTGLRK